MPVQVRPLFQAASLCLLGAAGTFALADDALTEVALSQDAADTRLTWNPCPPFMPAGCGIAVLHGDPAKPNVDVFLKVPGKSEIPNHWHSSAERMVLVSGEMHVSYDGQPMVILKPGMYAYGPAKKAHSASCVSESPCVLFIAFESALDAVAVEAAKEKS